MIWQGLKEFWQRYKSVWVAVWNVREQLDPPKRDQDERDFLPAHLELTETPVSNAPKWAARLIISFFFITLIWAIFGHMDVVASAEGKTILNGYSKTIQSAEGASVTNILVKNAQHVQAGDVLIELDIIGAKSDLEKATLSLQAAKMAQLRSNSLLKALSKKIIPELILEDTNHTTHTNINNNLSNSNLSDINLSESNRLEAQYLVRSQYDTWLTQDERISASIRQKEAENITANALLNKLEQSIDILSESTQDYEKLLSKKGISKHAYFDKKRELTDLKNELIAQQSRLVEIKESIFQQQKEQDLATRQLERDTLDQLRIAKEQINQFSAEKNNAEQRLKLSILTAPVTGTVQQLAVHTVGGIVSHAQALMVIVPDTDDMEAEVLVANKDIGFLAVGQDVVIKLEAFPYTRYGYITGKVRSLSFDAIEHEKLGLVFQTLISLDKNYLMINDNKVILNAGMNITAEIKTGKRRVITYFLSPLQTKIQESLRER